MEKRGKRSSILRAFVEMGFIIFLFYSNLLMGELTQSKIDGGRKFWSALMDIFSIQNFLIAIVASVIGYFVFSYLRKRI